MKMTKTFIRSLCAVVITVVFIISLMLFLEFFVLRGYYPGERINSSNILEDTESRSSFKAVLFLCPEATIVLSGAEPTRNVFQMLSDACKEVE